MTHKERLLKTYRCEKTDRAAVPAWLGFWPWGQTTERWKVESGKEDLDIYSGFKFDPGCHFVWVDQGPRPAFEQKTIEETDEFIIATDSRGITTRNRKDHMSMPEFMAYPVKTPDDWKKYKEQRLQTQLEQRVDGLNERAAQLDGKLDDAPVQVGTFPWGVFGSVRDLMGAEEILLAFYDYPEMVHDMMATHVTLWIKLWQAVADKIQIDHIHIWEDMSGKQGSLISMAMVEEFMMPHYDRIARFAADNGITAISVDSDGLVDELVPMMMRHGVNVFFPFEVQAGNDVREYRRKYPDLCIMGGLDKNALSKGRKEVQAELDKAADMLQSPGYIVGFDHLIPPDAKWDNFQYFMTELAKLVDNA